MNYPNLLATHEDYIIKHKDSPEHFTICSYRSGGVEVICKDTGEVKVFDKELFKEIENES